MSFACTDSGCMLVSKVALISLFCSNKPRLLVKSQLKFIVEENVLTRSGRQRRRSTWTWITGGECEREQKSAADSFFDPVSKFVRSLFSALNESAWWCLLENHLLALIHIICSQAFICTLLDHYLMRLLQYTGWEVSMLLFCGKRRRTRMDVLALYHLAATLHPPCAWSYNGLFLFYEQILAFSSLKDVGVLITQSHFQCTNWSLSLSLILLFTRIANDERIIYSKHAV